ncbi:hypothetical protein P12x_000044 [Tundrisphaera lichenicola]|uniref:hypothetical protein n=1 Tax=Tundrisphaera lichenicola TaxID=2029860 RepID=UPI003EBD4B51
MRHLASKLGDFLHFHPLAHRASAGKHPSEADAPGSIDAQGHAREPDDLSFLGLRCEHRETPAPTDLGRFALLSKDGLAHQARIDEVWDSAD